jgi:DNA-directed RNA polymerase specialized sigma24 family protein
MDKPLGDDRRDAPQPCAERVWADFLAVLDTLPPTTRMVFLMHEVFGASCREIEYMTGVPGDTCNRHLDDAHRSVRDFTHARNESTKGQTP